MEKGVRKIFPSNKEEKGKSSSSNDGDSSKRNASKSPKNEKEVNSWDRSTLTSNRDIPKGKTNDWDSSSECQETMVEPFDSNDNPQVCENWDSESEGKETNDDVAEVANAQPFRVCSFDSCELSLGNFSDIIKTSESDTDRVVTKTGKEEFLLVEDFEEFLKDETEKSPRSRGTIDFRAEVRSNESEGTPEDTTIWMIPKSERTQSGEYTSKLISSSDREKINSDKIKKLACFLKKNKSLSDVQKKKSRRRTARSYRSEYLGSQKSNYNSFLICEGSDLKRKLEIETEKTKANISGRESFDRTRVFFTEYECRTMTMDKDIPEKLSTSSRSVMDINEERMPEDVQALSNANSEGPLERNTNATSEAAINHETERAGPSGVTSMDVVSLPDMIGRKSLKDRNWDETSKKSEKKTSEKEETKETPPEDIGASLMSESWLLLDDTGQYQTITRNVVSILLNGRSADAVLQGRKEHFIRNVTLKDTNSLKNSLTSIIAQESVQQVLKEEDVGGEDDRKRIIDLERKVENTLFYIQPGMNHTASVRIIPLDTEMIHVWRRTRDGGSTQSLEVYTMNSSQDSVDATSVRSSIDHHSSITRRPFVEEPVSEEDETQPHEDSPTVDGDADPDVPGPQESEVAEYTKMLFETKTIVDSLMNNFIVLQNRLDGQAGQGMTLQGVVTQLREFLTSYEGKVEEDSRDVSLTQTDSVQSQLTSTPSFLVIKGKTDLKSESVMEERFEEGYSKSLLEVQDKSTSMECLMTSSSQFMGPENVRITGGNEVITVNIYTMESFTPGLTCGKNQDNYTIVQSNLRVIEQKMRNLQEQNDSMLKQNVELKRKLREISSELEKYLDTTSEREIYVEETRELETLRDQVCNLKLELENFKRLVRDQKNQYTEKNSLIREESKKSLLTLKTWCTVAREIFEKIESTRSKLEENEITIDINPALDLAEYPESFSEVLASYIEETAGCMWKMKNENFLLEQTVREDYQKESNTSREFSNLDQVISGYSELIEQCKKGQLAGETESKVMEDYFTVIMEKASLTEEIKILKTENEMLLESQLEHYEKLKQTMIALKDRKSEITALESSQKLLEEERTKIAEVLKLCEEEKKALEVDITDKSRIIEDLIEEMKRKDLEIADGKERLNAAAMDVSNFEKSCRMKEELINELKIENDELLASDAMKNNQIEILKEEIKNLKMQEAHLENELSSSKLFLSETQKEMTDYITHLEALMNSSQESLDKVKQKLKESNQTINRLKSENDVLDKQHQCDLKLFNKTKDELESCKEKLTKLEKRVKESEEEREMFQIKWESLASSEKEKSEALEALAKEYRTVIEENADLVEKIQIFSKDKDDSLKEQKDLINKYAMMSKEIQKLQDKYRNVKSECNERTDLIKYLEMMLKENIVEHNNRVASLEQNISRIIDKIVACKDGMREKHFGVDAEVRELRHQLDITYQERKEMENVVNNYYSLTKHLEQEIQEREKKVDELHTKLSMEQQKAIEYENERKSYHVLQPIRSSECLKIEQLESQISMADRELEECKKELQCCQATHDSEKKKLELTIADLKSEVKRYQLRIEVMMKNLSNGNKNMNGFSTDKRSTDESEIQSMKKELQEKNKTITELKETIDRYKAEVKLKECDLENSNKRGFHQNEELKNLQNQINKMQDAMSTTNKTNAMQQKERDEMTEKLFQSIKLIMDERSARQTIESLIVEKEKNFRNQIDQIKNELVLKVKEYEAVTGELEEKKKLVSRLQDDLRKMKTEVSSLKGQVSSYRKRNSYRGNGDGKMGEELLNTSTSLTQIKSQNVSPERLESCMRELKEIRDLNLELRKTEGQYQAKIVRLEDEIRDARLLIKELQGDIKTEKKSKKAFKNMIMAAKMEIEKCVLAKQLMSVIAERISRHLDLSEIPSREFLSGFRLSDSSGSTKCLPE